jgi:hypothetical protein
MPAEQWKDVFGYEELYQVSDRGRVKSLFYGSKIDPGKIKPIRKDNE